MKNYVYAQNPFNEVSEKEKYIALNITHLRLLSMYYVTHKFKISWNTVCIMVSNPLKNTTLFFSKPPMYWLLVKPAPQSLIFQWTPIILKFFIFNPVLSFKSN